MGELSSIKKASAPLLAALGGMAVPALIFISLNLGTENTKDSERIANDRYKTPKTRVDFWKKKFKNNQNIIKKKWESCNQYSEYYIIRL